MRGRTIGSTLTGMTLLLAASGCTDLLGDSQSTESAALGDALPGTNATTFAAAKANFVAAEGAPDGLIRRARSVAPARTSSGATGR